MRSSISYQIYLKFSFQLPIIMDKMDSEKETVLTRLVTLDTPGKAAVEVVILADPVCQQQLLFRYNLILDKVIFCNTVIHRIVLRFFRLY